MGMKPFSRDSAAEEIVPSNKGLRIVGSVNLCKDSVRGVRWERKGEGVVMQPLLYSSHHGLNHRLRDVLLLKEKSELGE